MHPARHCAPSPIRADGCLAPRQGSRPPRSCGCLAGLQAGGAVAAARAARRNLAPTSNAESAPSAAIGRARGLICVGPLPPRHPRTSRAAATWATARATTRAAAAAPPAHPPEPRRCGCRWGAGRGGWGAAGTAAGGTAHGPGTAGARGAAARSEGWAGGCVARVGPLLGPVARMRRCASLLTCVVNIIICVILCPWRDSGARARI